jgi:hypothetical protein
MLYYIVVTAPKTILPPKPVERGCRTGLQTAMRNSPCWGAVYNTAPLEEILGFG